MTSTTIRFRIHFGGGTTLGPGKIDLLEQIALTGSLSKAARAMDMSYRRGWELLDSMNSSYTQPVAVTAKGGRGGGGATLTAFGRELILVYRRFDTQLQKRALLAFGPIAGRLAEPRRGTARAPTHRRRGAAS